MAVWIYVDFNTTAKFGPDRVYIGTDGALRQDQEFLKSLHPGTPVVLYDEEMEVEAFLERVTYREDFTAWVGRPDWPALRDLPTGERQSLNARV